MEKISFELDDGGKVDFFVLETARLSGKDYILVTDTEEGDGEALILCETPGSDKKEGVYEIVEDDEELEALSSLFESLMEDVKLDT